MTANARSISPELLNTVRQTLKDFVANYPDVSALIADGKLIEKGRGWYEVPSSATLNEIGKFLNETPKLVNGKIRVKLRKLTKRTEALAARL